MNHPTNTTGIFSALILMLCIQASQGGSATWDLNPSSGDWNTATNWTPMTVPNGSADTATFALSNTTAISISANTELNGITFTAAATNSYTISVGNSPVFPRQLEISGAGITNNSGIMQNFVTVGGVTEPCAIIFTNSASAGTLTVFSNTGGTGSFAGPGETLFFGNASAGNATFINGGTSGNRGVTEFNENSTAANGTFINDGGGLTRFLFGGTTAANGTFINNGGTFLGAFGGVTELDESTGANAVFTNNGASVSGAFGGVTSFGGGTAANAIIKNNGASISGGGAGRTFFFGASAGDATLIANGGMGGGQGGAIFFFDESSGGTSRVEVFGNGNLDISFMNFPHNGTRGVTVGSIEGDGNVFLGGKNLTVGSSDLSTAFSGVIQDGGQNGGIGGSLTKIGTGTLTLSGTNIYTGNTNINGGVLQVDGSITSNTFVNHGGTLAGTGTVIGNVTNNGGTVSPGDAPGTLTVNNYTQSGGSLLIDIAGSNTGQFSVLDVLGDANLNGSLHPVLLNGFTPTIGESFTFLDYASLTGVFSRIQNQVFDNGMLQWSVTYDPNHANLTVEQHTPDRGSTLLLLTLGLLGLVTFRRQLVRRQP